MKNIIILIVVLGVATLACSTQDIWAMPTTPTTPTPVLSARSEEMQSGQKLTVTAAIALNLRNIPDAAGPIDSFVILRMPGGSRVTWLNKCNGVWAKIQYKDRIGWAVSSLLDPEVCQ